VIVEEERPRRLRREPGGQDCFPVPLTFEAALARGLVYYFGAELAASSLPEAMPFTVGDNQTYRGFWNPPLEPRKAYLIYFQAASHLKGVRGQLDHGEGGWGGGWQSGEQPITEA
jgi:receptor-type tyrosine-protein phosphatase U